MVRVNEICERVLESEVCIYISGEDCVWYICDVLYAVLYVRLSCFVVRGCLSVIHLFKGLSYYVYVIMYIPLDIHILSLK